MGETQRENRFPVRIRARLCAGLLLVLSLSSAGCSVFFVKGPPVDHESRIDFECNEGDGWPMADAIWASVNGLAVAYVALLDGEVENRGPAIVVGLAALAVWGGSALYGFRAVSECRKARLKQAYRPASWIEGYPALPERQPQPLQSPPQPLQPPVQPAEPPPPPLQPAQPPPPPPAPSPSPSAP